MNLKRVFLLSENPLARNVAPLLRALNLKKVNASSVKLGDEFPATIHSIIHCFGLVPARKTRGVECPRVITISEPPAKNFIMKRIQRAALKDAKLVATSKYIGKLWKIPTIITQGLNLEIFNPEAIPARRQTDILSKYNIPHDKKMIVCSSPALGSLPSIIAALRNVTRNDFIIAMLGGTSKFEANKMIRLAGGGGEGGRIIFIGDETDIPSLMKAAFATVSLSKHDHVAASIAVGTPTIAADTEFAKELAVNYLVVPNDPARLAAALDEVLALTEKQIEKITQRNAKFAKENLSIMQSAEAYIEIYSKL
ncbi:MAG: glycosyltransferase [Alphaproteobacteria bacterium]|nr:glycosyltransferase [Alphaproteobacteria bacterium]